MRRLLRWVKPTPRPHPGGNPRLRAPQHKICWGITLSRGMEHRSLPFFSWDTPQEVRLGQRPYTLGPTLCLAAGGGDNPGGPARASDGEGFRNRAKSGQGSSIPQLQASRCPLAAHAETSRGQVQPGSPFKPVATLVRARDGSRSLSPA
jgi:hypothetical protein